MDSGLVLASSLHLKLGSSAPSLTRLNPSKLFSTGKSHSIRMIRASSEINPSSHKPIIQKIKTSGRAIVFAATALSVLGKFQQLPAIANPQPPPLTEQIQETQVEKSSENDNDASLTSSNLPESNPESIEGLTTLLLQKMEVGEDGETLNILKKLVLIQPENNGWKLLMARLLNEIGEIEAAQKVFEEILAENPLSFEALFENSLLMDRCGKGQEAIDKLQAAVNVAELDNKKEEARDVRLIIAQILFLQKNVEAALKNYEDLEKEDPDDFRPYFCKGMIYTRLGKDKEAKEQFSKYRKLSPKKFEIERYLRTPISRMKLFASNEKN